MPSTAPFGVRDVDTTQCRRGCCWTPYGHSAEATNCTCHDEPTAKAA
jgi:hypothetical protein